MIEWIVERVRETQKKENKSKRFIFISIQMFMARTYIASLYVRKLIDGTDYSL